MSALPFDAARERHGRHLLRLTPVLSVEIQGPRERARVLRPPAGEGWLSSDAVGEVELDGRVLVIRRIHVTHITCG